MRASVVAFGFLGFAGLLCGCAAGGGTVCTSSSVFRVGPTAATANHSAVPPGNQQQFTATESATAPPGCAVPALAALVYPDWTSSDPLDVTVSSAANYTNGLATCVNATSDPVTLTATEGTGATAQTGTVTLTCN